MVNGVNGPSLWDLAADRGSAMDSYMQLRPNLTTIKVIGVGGGGCNAVDRMIEAGVGGVEFIAVNTDAMALSHSTATSKIVIGLDGRGAGGKPAVGQAAADKSREEIKAHLEGADMVFVASGLGGGTGTGAAPIIAAVARELGALTVSIVTMPFDFEGSHRMRLAKEGLAVLKKESDTLIEIQNDRLKSLVDPNAPLKQAFMVADEMLRQGIQGITDLINITGLINIDFADVSAIMRDGHTAMMTIGIGAGEDRAVTAARQVVTSPLLNLTLSNARGVLFNVKGGEDLGLVEASEAAEIIRKTSAPDANIIFGAIIDPAMKDTVQITLIATGFGQNGDELAAASQPPASVPAKDQELPVGWPPGGLVIDDPDVDIPPFLRK
jgi:cell division protein FtsZ